MNLICSGHRIGTAEIESALVSHPLCAEAAVVGVEHEVLHPFLPSLFYYVLIWPSAMNFGV